MSEKCDIIRAMIAAIMLAATFVIEADETVMLSIYIVAYLIIGYDVILSAGRNIVNGTLFAEHFLMTVATLGAFLIKEHPEAILVMLLYQIGMIFQSRAVNKSRRSIAELMDICPDHANLETPDGVQTVAPSDVKVGDTILVKPGEKVPLDGKVITGTSNLDTSVLTGESIPRSISPDEEILSGFINLTSPLRIEVTKIYSDSTVSKVLEMVEDASNRKSKSEEFITKFAKYYTPLVVLAAFLIAIIPPLLFEGGWGDWTHRALVFLVISCPCALVISIPLTFFGGIGGASRSGILMKGSNYLEALARAKTVVFDKTGTLTKGVFKVQEVHAIEMSQTKLLEVAAHAEAYSNHPIAKSLRDAYGKDIDMSKVTDVTEVPGEGIAAKVSGCDVKVGNIRLIGLDDNGIEDTAVHVSVNGEYKGYITLADEIKDDAFFVVGDLEMEGVERIVLLTGDRKEIAMRVADEIGITEVHAEMLPQDKVRVLEEIIYEARGKVIFVGDGVNDAPVLARSDIGMAMGALGSDAAMEAADVVIMSDEPSKVATAIKISKRTVGIGNQNLSFALATKAVIMMFGVLGYVDMWLAVFADVGVMLIAVFNSLRALRIERSYDMGVDRESHCQDQNSLRN